MSLPLTSKLRLRLNSRKIYILPTRWGMLYSILILIILLLAINYKISLAYYSAFLLAALGLVAIMHTWLNLLDLDVDLPTIKAEFSGNTAQIKLRISNHQSQIRHAIGVYKDKTNIYYLDVDHQAIFSIPVIAEKRGWQSIPQLTLFSTYPLGLFRAWARIPHETKLLVYPKPSKMQYIATTLAADSNDTFATQTSTQKGDADFNGHRHYQKGDPIKHIDWKASSKHEDLLSKEFSADLPEALWFDWSIVEARDNEERISLLTRAIIEANTNNQTYGLKLPDVRFKPENTVSHYHACLKALALL